VLGTTLSLFGARGAETAMRLLQRSARAPELSPRRQIIGVIIKDEDWFKPEPDNGRTVVGPAAASSSERLASAAFRATAASISSNLRVPGELFCVNCHSQRLLTRAASLRRAGPTREQS
jgi:hypothetical protein